MRSGRGHCGAKRTSVRCAPSAQAFRACSERHTRPGTSVVPGTSVAVDRRVVCMRLIRGVAATVGLLACLSSISPAYAAGGPGLTRMVIETPAAGATIPPAFIIAGYAFDPQAVSGSGVDGVVVYAFRNFGSGEPAIFLGTATYGITRDDVARAFGAGF